MGVKRPFARESGQALVFQYTTSSSSLQKKPGVVPTPR
jgi:hypothetical protein